LPPHDHVILFYSFLHLGQVGPDSFFLQRCVYSSYSWYAAGDRLCIADRFVPISPVVQADA
jgi:hypothetical protein